MKLPILFLLLLAAGFCRPASAQINWKHTNGPEGGLYWFPCYNSQYTFYPDEYNLYRTSDGSSWEKLPVGNLWPMAALNSTIVAQQGSGFNYVAQQNRMLISHNNGESWIEGTLPPVKYGYFTEMAFCSQGIFVPDQGKLYRSQDEALTWDEFTPPEDYIYDVWTGNDRLYVSNSIDIWRLATNGTDWELISPNFGQQEYVASFYASATAIFVSTSDNIWASTNNGVSWSKRPMQWASIGSFAQIGNRVYKSGGETGLIYTDDSGLNWNEVPIAYDHSPFELAPAGGNLLCNITGRGIYRLDQASGQMTEANNGLTSAYVKYLDSQNGTLWAACANGLFPYNLATKQWGDKALLPSDDRLYYPQVAISKSGKIATFKWNTDHFYLSSDNGISWDTIRPFSFWDLSPVEKLTWLDDVLLVHGLSKDIRSDDFGQTWTEINCPLHIVSFNEKHYGVHSGRLYLSTNAGLSWELMQGPDLDYMSAIFTTQDKLFVIGRNEYGSALYISSDGTQWQYANDGLPQLYTYSSSTDVYNGNTWNVDGKYYLYALGDGLFASLDTCKTWVPIEQYLSGNLTLIDTTFYLGGSGGGVVETGIPDKYGALSRGLVYKDDNNNGIHDAGEIVLPNLRVNLVEANSWRSLWFATTKEDGRYAIGSTANAADTLRLQLKSNYVAQINPPQRVITGSGDERDFGIHFTADITDVTIAGNHAGHPRPGFDLNTYLFYANEGTLPASGTISLKLDSHIQFTEADPQPSAVIGNDSLVWDFDQLPILAHRNIRVRGHIEASVPLGTVLKSRGHIVPSVPDYTPANNHVAITDTVVGSFDPNDKSVQPAAGLSAGDIDAGRDLVYTIQFQNTGTFQADRVRITDLLDTALNLSTLRFVASSHEMTSFRLLPGRLLEMVFGNIALPDSNSNEAASHGFVTIAIQRYKSFHPGFAIKNKAAIYFDFNEPIITNTMLTKFLPIAVSTAEPDVKQPAAPSLIISPNPTKKNFRVDTEGRQSGPGTLEILNMAGQVCFRQQVADLSQPLEVRNARLSEGLYIVRSSGRDGVLTGKLAVQH